MKRRGLKGNRIIALTILGIIAFNPPLLLVFDRGAGVTLFGIPLFFVYLFAAWAGLIVLLARVINRAQADEAENAPNNGGS
ncbi:MAG: hypothetical protein ACPGNT_05475 [Rhodospirillales bacterium]